MIKITRAEYVGGKRIRLTFSTCESGIYDMQSILARGGTMIQPLLNELFFQGFFLELGALAWPNGFELNPHALYQELKQAGILEPSRAA